MLTFRVIWRRLSLLKFGTARPRSISRSTLSTNPVVCRSHAVQHLHRQAGLDRAVAVVRLPASLPCRRSLPDHGGVEPDRQRATLLQRFVIGRPVPGLVGGRSGSAHALQLPCWIHKMNPSPYLCSRPPAAATRRFMAVLPLIRRTRSMARCNMMTGLSALHCLPPESD